MLFALSADIIAKKIKTVKYNTKNYLHKDYFNRSLILEYWLLEEVMI